MNIGSIIGGAISVAIVGGLAAFIYFATTDTIELNSPEGKQRSFEQAMVSAHYAKDAKGICYAMFDDARYYRAVTTVPCEQAGL